MKAGLKIDKASLKSAFQDLATRLLIPQQNFPSCQTTPVMQKATTVCFSISHVSCRLPMGTLTRQNPAHLRRFGEILWGDPLETSSGLKDLVSPPKLMKGTGRSGSHTYGL